MQLHGGVRDGSEDRNSVSLRPTDFRLSGCKGKQTGRRTFHQKRWSVNLTVYLLANKS